MEIISSKDKSPVRKYIAFFDLDNTILSVNSGKSLIRLAYKNGLMTRKELYSAMWYSVLYKLNLSETERLLVKMVKWIRGKSVKSLEDLVEELFSDHVLKSIRPEIESEIRVHKENGAEIVILSSSIKNLCRRVSDHLGGDYILCSDLETLNNVYTGKPEGKLCFGPEKAFRLKEYCLKTSTNPSESYYYGDSVADIPALHAVGNPVCVSPDKKLKRAALKYGWRVMCQDN